MKYLLFLILSSCCTHKISKPKDRSFNPDLTTEDCADGAVPGSKICVVPL